MNSKSTKDIKKELKSFGITMGSVFTLISLFFFFKHKAYLPYFLTAVSFFLITWARPAVLKPLNTSWMKLAEVLNWINTRLILALMFCFIFIPIGIVLKILNKDLLDLKIDKSKDTYWRKKEKNQLGLTAYEKQF